MPTRRWWGKVNSGNDEEMLDRVVQDLERQQELERRVRETWGWLHRVVSRMRFWTLPARYLRREYEPTVLLWAPTRRGLGYPNSASRAARMDL
jgi:hypothetical protein